MLRKYVLTKIREKTRSPNQPILEKTSNIKKIPLKIFLKILRSVRSKKTRVSYSGYYTALPRLKHGFDSRHALQKKSHLNSLILVHYYIDCTTQNEKKPHSIYQAPLHSYLQMKEAKQETSLYILQPLTYLELLKDLHEPF